MLKSEVIGPVGSGGPLETGHVICPGCAHNFTAIPENARERIAELEAALQEIVDLDNNPDDPVPYSWGLDYFRRAHAIAKAALVSDDGRSAECT